MFFTAYLVRQLREIASIVDLTGIASEIVGESSDGVCALALLWKITRATDGVSARNGDSDRAARERRWQGWRGRIAGSVG
jgi:hypothetical protein